MRSLRITAALVLMVFAARGARAAADEPRAGEFFSGAFMIALRGEAAEAVRRELTDPEKQSPLTLMYAASESEENELDASTWVLTRPYVNEGSPGPGNASAWDDAYEILDYPKILGELGFSEKVIALMAKPGAVQAIEPDIAIWDPEIEELHRRLADAGEVPDDLHDAEADRGAEPPYLVAAAVLPARGTTVTVAKGERFAGPWPPPRNSPFAWHFDSDHSNLAAARAKVQASERPARVLIYHLDTGYYAANDTMRPRYLDPVRSISFLTDDGHTGKPHFPPGKLWAEGGPQAQSGRVYAQRCRAVHAQAPAGRRRHGTIRRDLCGDAAGSRRRRAMASAPRKGPPPAAEGLEDSGSGVPGVVPVRASSSLGGGSASLLRARNTGCAGGARTRAARAAVEPSTRIADHF